MSTCDYAGCDLLAEMHEDGWGFCRRHYREHRADMHGEPWPPLRPVNLRAFFTPPCGTASAARAHYRRGEKPCPACAAADHRHRRPQGDDIRRGSYYRPRAS